MIEALTEKERECLAYVDQRINQKINDHHWEYWLLIGTSGKIEVLEMDLPSIIEMLCDWTAMSVKFKNMPSIWFGANKGKMILDHDTLQTILHWLPLFDDIYNQMTAKVEEVI